MEAFFTSKPQDATADFCGAAGRKSRTETLLAAKNVSSSEAIGSNITAISTAREALLPTYAQAPKQSKAAASQTIILKTKPIYLPLMRASP
jgi:hypothetical protein